MSSSCAYKREQQRGGRENGIDVEEREGEERETNEFVRPSVRSE